MERNELVTIRTYATRIDGEVDRSFLEANGIHAFVTADDAGGSRAFPFQFTYGAELKVRKSDTEKARALLNLN